MTPVSRAHRLIEDRVSLLGRQRLPFSQACGRVLAEAILTPRDEPSEARSAVDGFALKGDDTPGGLQVIGELGPQERFEGILHHGQAMRVRVGSRLPEGSDVVARVEDVEGNEESIRVTVELAPGTDVLAPGSDLTAGGTELPAGRRLRPQDVSLLASMGILEVQVGRRPRVRVIPVGRALAGAGAGTDRLRSDGNGYQLAALVDRDGGEAELHPIVRDELEPLVSAISAPGADLVVVSGGLDVGREDLGAEALRECGELAIEDLALRPAGRSGLGFIRDIPVVLAPGHAFAALVAWDLLGRYVVQRQLGLPPRLPYAKVQVRLTEEVPKQVGRAEVTCVTVHESSGGPGLATPASGHIAFSSYVVRADGFLYLLPDAGPQPAGAIVDAYLY